MGRALQSVVCAFIWGLVTNVEGMCAHVMQTDFLGGRGSFMTSAKCVPLPWFSVMYADGSSSLLKRAEFSISSFSSVKIVSGHKYSCSA